MYALAGTLDPDACFALSRATFGEMALAGITCVGEFHYLHHAPDGDALRRPERDGPRRARRGRRGRASASRCSTRATCTAASSASATRDAAAWAERVDALAERPTARVGAAIHSVRAVDPESARVGGGVGGGAAAARARLRAAEGERGVPRDARPHADRAARRRRRAVGALHRRPRDAPDRRRRRAARRRRRHGLPVPDDRARPRRRHRPGAAAARRRRVARAPAATRRR